MHMEHMRCRRQVVDDHLNRAHVFRNRNEGCRVSSTCAFGVQQGALWLHPWLDLCEHIHSVGSCIWRFTRLETWMCYTNVHDVSDVCLFWLWADIDVLHLRPRRPEIGVPDNPTHLSGRQATSTSGRRIIATKQLLGGTPWLRRVTCVMQKGPELARVNLRHLGSWCSFQERRQIINSRYQIVTCWLISTDNNICPLTCMQVEC
mmetsp:Transcript_100921/g.179070  ORF Transcript_100921/g.179070 Transcript_100921/m.179070 type:complete len:204 (-) Transcript_100921:1348-1959(-)